jgi:16S rRNA (guanine527-N7)-methyltransferase
VTGSPADDVEPMPAVARQVFGARLPLAIRYVELLAGAGVERGLIGPRERSRLWTRHVLNSASIAGAFDLDVARGPADAGRPRRVVDLGSGAGLPGVPLALARPDLQVTLLEPLARRVSFLDEAIETLGLDIDVLRGRAEDVSSAGWDVVVARAVAPLERLLALAGRLVQAGGMLLAVKGRGAAAEIDAARDEVRRWSTQPADLLAFGEGETGATVVRVVFDRPRSADAARVGSAGAVRRAH